MAIGKIDNETTTCSFFPAHFDFTTAQIVINWTLKIYALNPEAGGGVDPRIWEGSRGSGSWGLQAPSHATSCLFSGRQLNRPHGIIFLRIRVFS